LYKNRANQGDVLCHGDASYTSPKSAFAEFYAEGLMLHLLVAEGAKIRPSVTSSGNHAVIIPSGVPVWYFGTKERAGDKDLHVFGIVLPDDFAKKISTEEKETELQTSANNRSESSTYRERFGEEGKSDEIQTYSR
jgi:hypothetical protein